MSAQLMRFCERLAREGYRVIAPDFFARSHDVDPTDFGAIIGSITPANLKGDFAAAADALRADGAPRSASPGSAWAGGSPTAPPSGPTTSASTPRCRSTAAASPASSASRSARRSCSSAARTRTSRWPTSKKVQAHHPRRGAVVVYPGADHGFMRDGSENYDAESATDAWARLLAFFGANLT